MRYARVSRCRCGGGSMPGFYDRRLWQWRPYLNRGCGVIVLPYVVRVLDPGWWRWKTRWWWREVRDR